MENSQTTVLSFQASFRFEYFLRKIMTICTIANRYMHTFPPISIFFLTIAMLLGQVKKDKMKTLKVLMYLLSFSNSNNFVIA
jgi:hypothetical protein